MSTLFSPQNFLLCDFFRHIYNKPRASKDKAGKSYFQNLLKHQFTLHRLKVFLCGQELGEQPHHRHFDKRIQIKRFLNSRMGCDAFLGEDIKEIKKPPTIDADALTIEVKEAVNSDLVFLFLESLGTTAEFTAFVLNEKIVDKLIVFNNEEYKSPAKPSFLTLGPLKVLELRKPGNVFYYSPKQLRNGMSDEVTAYLDGAISKVWFNKCIEFGGLPDIWTFESFVAMASIYAFHPISTDDLASLLVKRLTPEEIFKGVKELVDREIIPRRQKRSIVHPLVSLESLDLSTGFQNDIGACRSRFLYERLNDLDFVNGYQLIYSQER